METLLIVTAIAAVFAAIFNGAQLLLQWYTLQEIGDLDKDRKDWFEHAPFRKYKDEK